MDGWVYRAACDADPAVRERPTDNNGAGVKRHIPKKLHRKKRRFFLFPTIKWKKKKWRNVEERWPSYYIYRGLGAGQWNMYISEPDIWFLSHRLYISSPIIKFIPFDVSTTIPFGQHKSWFNHASAHPLTSYKSHFYFQKWYSTETFIFFSKEKRKNDFGGCTEIQLPVQIIQNTHQWSVGRLCTDRFIYIYLGWSFWKISTTQNWCSTTCTQQCSRTFQVCW